MSAPSGSPAVELRTVRATAYVTPLREGGSLPGLIEADDDGMYVAKFRGAGQGSALLVAELVVGELGRLLGVRVPELVVVDLDARIAPREPDEEVQDLLAASAGTNLGLDYLPGSVGYDGRGSWTPPPAEAARVLWLDAFTANVDRTWRNPNLLVWHRTLWAIDHAGALVFQHAWPDPAVWARRNYDLTEHVLLPVAREVGAAAWADLDRELAAAVTGDVITAVLDLVPDEWLIGMNSARSDADRRAAAGLPARTAAQWRERFADYLTARLAGDRTWQQGLVP